jgi:hypothetical protein
MATLAGFSRLSRRPTFGVTSFIDWSATCTETGAAGGRLSVARAISSGPSPL